MVTDQQTGSDDTGSGCDFTFSTEGTTNITNRTLLENQDELTAIIAVSVLVIIVLSIALVVMATIFALAYKKNKTPSDISTEPQAVQNRKQSCYSETKFHSNCL